VPGTPSKKRTRKQTDAGDGDGANSAAVPQENNVGHDEVLQGDELIGANLSIGIKVDTIRGLLPDAYRDVTYRFKWFKDTKATKSEVGAPATGMFNDWRGRN